jgi:hypothetical protein
MNYYEFKFEYKTRPLYREGRDTQETKVFAANDLAEAYRLAQKYWSENGNRTKCKITLIAQYWANPVEMRTLYWSKDSTESSAAPLTLDGFHAMPSSEQEFLRKNFPEQIKALEQSK